jgi:hypothetical protein
MSSSPVGFCLCFALCAVVTPLPLWAQEPAGPDSSELDPGAQAAIVLVGAAGRDPELRALLTELLERRHVGVQLSTRSEFDSAELLGGRPPSGAVQVFVVPGSAGSVRVYFRAPDGERFLLRRVLLRAGFDEVGREQLGQIVETATLALLEPGAGLSREQAEQALTQERFEPEPGPPGAAANPKRSPQAGGAAPPPDAKTPATPRESMTLEGWLALRYRAVVGGSGLGLAHGPGAELGLSAKRRWLLRLRLRAERDFPQTLETAQVSAEIRGLRWTAAADAGLELARAHWLLLSLGLGQDRASVTPLGATGSNVAPAPAFDHQAPVAEAELRYEAGSWLRLVVALGADASLVRTHYDVTHPDEEPERVARPWPFRPSLSLGLAFCPELAAF